MPDRWGASPPAIIVHDLAGAIAALKAAADLGTAVVLRSAPGAVTYLGARLFLEIVAQARLAVPGASAMAVVDCGADAGHALSAMRHGATRIRVDLPVAARARLAAFAAARGAAIDDDAAPALDLHNFDDPLDACRIWLTAAARAGQAAAAPVATKQAPVYTMEGYTMDRERSAHGLRRHRGETAMRVTRQVKSILANYESDNPATKANIARILCTGKLAGTGKMVILPVDQGFEHGPHRSFAPNPPAYDPEYHCSLAVAAGLNAYAAPLGMIEQVADSYAGQIPFILKLNSSNTLHRAKGAPNQAITASVDDAVRLGAAAIGFTIYPGSDEAFTMMGTIKEMRREAAAKGIATVIWSYPRGGNLSKSGELAIDIGAYGCHMAALLGAHIIKIKLPTADIEQDECRKVYEAERIDISTQAARVAHCVDAAFRGRRLVVFSGGAKKGADQVYQDARDIRDGGGNGSIIGRNTFQRPRQEAIDMLTKIINIYLGKE